MKRQKFQDPITETSISWINKTEAKNDVVIKVNDVKTQRPNFDQQPNMTNGITDQPQIMTDDGLNPMTTSDLGLSTGDGNVGTVGTNVWSSTDDGVSTPANILDDMSTSSPGSGIDKPPDVSYDILDRQPNMTYDILDRQPNMTYDILDRQPNMTYDVIDKQPSLSYDTIDRNSTSNPGDIGNPTIPDGMVTPDSGDQVTTANGQDVVTTVIFPTSVIGDVTGISSSPSNRRKRRRRMRRRFRF